MDLDRHDPRLDLQSARRLRHAYSLALVFIAALCIMGQVAVQISLDQSARDAPILKQAARQQFLAQRIARLTMQARMMEGREPTMATVTTKQLEANLLEFEHAQEALFTESSKISASAAENSEIREVLEKAKHSHAAVLSQSRAFLAGFASDERGKDGRLGAELIQKANYVWLGSDDYSSDMNALAKALKSAVESRQAFLSSLQFVLLGLTLAALGAMALFLSRPLAAMLDRAINTLMASRERAEDMARTRAEFLAKASHEFRTPLNAIIGFERLLMGTELDDEQRDYVASSHRSAEHLLQLVNGILDYSKYESGEFVLDPIPFPVLKLVEDVIELNTLEARRRGLELRFDHASDLPQVVLGDPLFLKQVLINLVRNAIKFTREGEVSVRLHMVDANRLRFAVADTGVGIPEAERAQIFEAFRQANDTTARPYEGSGLGLTISKQLIERMGGELKLTTSPGRGSTFSFDLDLPMVESRSWAGAERTFELTPTAPPEPGQRHVLLAEDNAVNARLTRMQLEKLGYTCRVVENGADAIAELPRAEYSLVLMDLHMPGTDGIEATRRIRDEDSEESSVPIVALTADLSEDSRRRAFEAGVDDYLTKPIRTEDLERVLESWLGVGNRRA